MIEEGKCYTIHPSDLYCMIYKIYGENDSHIKVKAMFFYKKTRSICSWLNPEHVPIDFDLLKSVTEHYKEHYY